MLRKIFLLVIINSSVLCHINISAQVHEENYLKFIDVSKNIEFKIYDRYGNITKEYGVCKTSDKFAILIHGWTESCEVPWMKLLIKNLIKHRGGCIFCMDYSEYSQLFYSHLLILFNRMANVLKDKLIELETFGFDPNRGYLFGFSYGAHLATVGAYKFGKRKIKEIDCCDMPGMGFDFKISNNKLSAKNVQCIQTSSIGTIFNSCHQNWKMGNCGYSQQGALESSFESHALCPHFYNSAFLNNFKAIERPLNCSNWGIKNAKYPSGFKMGYMQKRKRGVVGVLYANTSRSYPFNVIQD